MKRLHPLGVVLATARIAGFPALVFGALGVIQGDLGRVANIAITILAAALAWGVSDWWRFRYGIEDDALVIERGVFTLERRVVPRGRIRGMDVSAPVAHRLFGLRRVTVDAAAEGGDGSEMTLAAVTEAEADALRRELLGTTPIVDTAPLARTSNGTLAVAGATNPRWLAVPFGIIGAGAGLVAGADPDAWKRAWEWVGGGGSISELGDIPIVTVLVVCLVAAVLVVATAATASVLSDGGFRLTDPPGRLSTERGLLRRRQVAIDRSRIVALSMREPLSWRPLGLAAVRARITGVGADSGAGAGRTQLLPAGTRQVAGALVDDMVPFAQEKMVAHPRRGRSRRLVRATAVPLAVTATLLARGQYLAAVLAAVIVVAFAAIGHDRWRSLASGVDGRLLRVREGSLARRTSTLQPDAAVAYRISSSPFQRRANLGTLEVKMGRGAGSVRALDAAPARVGEMAGELDAALLNSFFTDGNARTPLGP